jgi:hypothetical protein
MVKIWHSPHTIKAKILTRMAKFGKMTRFLSPIQKWPICDLYTKIQNCILPPIKKMASSTHTHTKKFQASTYQKHNIFENPIPKYSIFEQPPNTKN